MPRVPKKSQDHSNSPPISTPAPTPLSLPPPTVSIGPSQPPITASAVPYPDQQAHDPQILIAGGASAPNTQIRIMNVSNKA